MSERIEALKARLAALDFELRFESDPREKDHIANERDAVARKLEREHTCIGMIPRDPDGLIDGKESRGFICPKCGEVIGLDPAEQCKNCERVDIADGLED